MNENTTKSPFKFLDSYGQDDRPFFYGRKAEVEELYDRVFETNLVLLYGESGSGKTSLVNCGLAGEFGPADWLPVEIRRNNHLMEALSKAIDEKALTRVSDENARLQQKIRSLYLDHYQPIYLIFDQFEELFISGSDEEAMTFFENIRELLNLELNTKILIIIRGEYLDKLSKYELVVPTLFDNRMYLEKMSRRNLYEVISQSCRYFGIEIQEEELTINAIIDNITDSRKGVELAILQIYMDKLYRNDLSEAEEMNRPVRFDAALLARTPRLEDLLGDFMTDQLELLESELRGKGVRQTGLPLDILFTLVTEDGTKIPLDTDQIKTQLLKRKKTDPEWVDYCIDRFNQLRIIRFLGKD